MPLAGAHPGRESGEPKMNILPTLSSRFFPQRTQIFACPVLSKSATKGDSKMVNEVHGVLKRIVGTIVEASNI